VAEYAAALRRYAVSPTGIIPERLMDGTKLREVVEWLIVSPYDFLTKKQLLRGWANVTRVRPSANDYALLRGTGIDEQA
jgi:hypothetical protein